MDSLGELFTQPYNVLNMRDNTTTHNDSQTFWNAFSITHKTLPKSKLVGNEVRH